jgi:phosphonate transport system ATP-binding protein
LHIKLTRVAARHPAAKLDGPAAIRDIDIAITQGEQVAVIGASGSGKTTLLHVLACAMQPTTGTFELDGVNPWTLATNALQTTRGELFLAPQVPPLPPRQRVVTTVLAGRLPHQGLLASLKSLFYPSDIPAAEAALARFDVAEKLFERVDRLSGGERQRVGLARALVSQASLFLVDEPLSALDPTRATQAIASLTSAAIERGATLVCTLHQVDTALASFPRIIGLRDGLLAFDLPSGEVTQEILRALYANKLDELNGPAPDVGQLAQLAQAELPAVMHCR